jgi:hypothetical protein
MRFTMGYGPNGLQREAYYVGWEVVGFWLSHGMRFDEIARIPEKQMPSRVAAAIDTLLSSSTPISRYRSSPLSLPNVTL